jgi:Carboxypeptidase regulatory-like domain
VRRKLITVAVLLLVAIAAVPYLSAGDQGPATRTLTGQVMKDSEAPLPGAVVYLKNSKTMAIRSVISDGQGNYRFASLSPDIDYEVHAEYAGAKSDKKTLSSFDSRKSARINLKINVQ